MVRSSTDAQYPRTHQRPPNREVYVESRDVEMATPAGEPVIESSSTPAFLAAQREEKERQEEFLSQLAERNRRETQNLFNNLEINPGSHARSVAKSQYSGQPNVIGNLHDEEMSDRDLTDPNGNEASRPFATNGVEEEA